MGGHGTCAGGCGGGGAVRRGQPGGVCTAGDERKIPPTPCTLVLPTTYTLILPIFPTPYTPLFSPHSPLPLLPSLSPSPQPQSPSLITPTLHYPRLCLSPAIWRTYPPGAGLEHWGCCSLGYPSPSSRPPYVSPPPTTLPLMTVLYDAAT